MSIPTRDIGRKVWEFEGEPFTRREILIARHVYALSFDDERPGFLSDAVRRQAEKRFPLPQIRRPLRVTMSDGRVWSYESECVVVFVEHRASGPTKHWPSSFACHLKTSGDFVLAGRIASGETELVEEPA